MKPQHADLEALALQLACRKHRAPPGCPCRSRRRRTGYTCRSRNLDAAELLAPSLGAEGRPRPYDAAPGSEPDLAARPVAANLPTAWEAA